MSPVHQVWPKPSCKAQWKGEEDKADSGRVGKTTSGNGQAWSLPSPRGQLLHDKYRRFPRDISALNFHTVCIFLQSGYLKSSHRNVYIYTYNNTFATIAGLAHHRLSAWQTQGPCWPGECCCQSGKLGQSHYLHLCTCCCCCCFRFFFFFCLFVCVFLFFLCFFKIIPCWPASYNSSSPRAHRLVVGMY